MARINYGRFFAGVLVAGIFFFLADGFIHGKLLARDHEAAIAAAGKPTTQDPSAYAYFVSFDLGKALVVMLLYVAARARFGPGVKTAVWAGLVGWLAIELVPNLANMPFPFYPRSVYVKWIALELVPIVIGTILGAWIYREPAPSAVAR